ncbi:hypothetical protein [Paraburkholderia aromaticivorans]|uniref:hypothetical protein n=1 Tax=Paraburkholderia aromaticivorans TaxID=2026199 RepID=UPI0014561419|nr:hypothetical protein [Paraburkholderia aromaticivorans]
MKKSDLHSLTRKIIVGAKAAAAKEHSARAYWLSVCREQLPENATASNVISLIKGAVKRGARHVKYDAALAALQSAIAEKERFIEPLFKMLQASDEVGTVAERIALCGVHSDHAKKAVEGYMSLWMIGSRMESPAEDIAMREDDPYVGEWGPLYDTIGWYVRMHAEGEEYALKILRAATPIPGIEKYGVHDGQLVRSWSPWAVSGDECADA